MSLTDDQKAAIARWLEAGETLSQVQSRLKSEFEISMTFMEVRFLIDDLNLELKKETPAPAPEADADEESSPVDALSPEGVSVEVDSIVTPGALVSGSVRFSDGVNAKWQLDQMGRLGLSDVEPGYKPSPEDVQEFQAQLQTELRNKGYG
ncbi:MAG: hypothetical protein ABQ298_02735 [Puniceicoccaceae bacterium]